MVELPISVNTGDRAEVLLNRNCGTFRGFGSFVLYEILQVEETTVREMGYWKATSRDNVLLTTSNGAPISRWLTANASTTKIKTSRRGLAMSLQHFLR